MHRHNNLVAVRFSEQCPKKRIWITDATLLYHPWVRNDAITPTGVEFILLAEALYRKNSICDA
jgi:hypothetical protein